MKSYFYEATFGKKVVISTEANEESAAEKSPIRIKR